MSMSNSTYRTETDNLGSRQLPAAALYGIHAVRARDNFPIAARPINPELIHAYGMVKLAAARTNHDLGCWPEEIFAAIQRACIEMADGELDTHIIVDALQGGAGTSTNMNVNEVLANRALQLCGHAPGEYKIISPLNDINRHQSTNDTYPTALRVAALRQLRKLQAAVISLLEAFQTKEKEFMDVVKVARTQMQDAVLTTVGREMSAYADAFARDRWRIYKCEERLRVINFGGTAIGSGLGAPRQFIFKATEHLRNITGFGLARAENLTDGTQNADSFVEVSGILKALSATLIKVANDLRFLSSGPHAGIGELNLPAVQAGSSIMPGKTNPVILEAVIQAALSAQAADQKITAAASSGNLELNPFMPLIADAMLEQIQFLTNAGKIMREKCVNGITVNEDRCRANVLNSTAAVTALVEKLGYEQATMVYTTAQQNKQSIRQTVLALGLISPDEFDKLISPEQVTQLGS